MAVLLIAPVSLPTLAAHYTGIAYDLDDGRVLYREAHYVDRAADGSGQRVVLYACADGKPFARKHLHYTADAVITPGFELFDARLGYREGVRTTGPARQVFVQRGREQPEQNGPLPGADPLVVDAGFDEFVRDHWDALQRGDSVRFSFLVPSRLDAWRFRIEKHQDVRIGDIDASVIRLGLGAWWGFLLPHIDVAYANGSRDLLRFEGISNMRDMAGDNYNVRIEFPPAERRPLADGELAEALRQPLTSRCGA
jgi:hypothetical protein